MKKSTTTYLILVLFSLSFLINSCQTKSKNRTAEITKVESVVVETKNEIIKDNKGKNPDTAIAKAEKKENTQPSLTLTFNNLESPSAPVVVGLYGTNNKFPDPSDQLKEYKFKPHGKTLTVKIPNLKFGTYALAIYQDVNSSGKIDKNMIGIPTEPYAFSNNYRPKIKAPNFNDCKFTYNAKSNAVSMNLIH